jgi:hypothetical protein
MRPPRNRWRLSSIRSDRHHAGVLVIRLENQPARAIRHAAERIASEVEVDDLRGCIAGRRDGGLRTRRPDP